MRIARIRNLCAPFDDYINTFDKRTVYMNTQVRAYTYNKLNKGNAYIHKIYKGTKCLYIGSQNNECGFGSEAKTCIIIMNGNSHTSVI